MSPANGGLVGLVHLLLTLNAQVRILCEGMNDMNCMIGKQKELLVVFFL